MKKLFVSISLLFILFSPAICNAYLSHTASDGFIVYVQQASEQTINIWCGDFRYPDELMVIELDDYVIKRMQTFNFSNNAFVDYKEQFIMFGVMVNTGGFFIQYHNKKLTFQNNFTGNYYQIGWNAPWGYTMAPYSFQFYNPWIQDGYLFEDNGDNL